MHLYFFVVYSLFKNICDQDEGIGFFMRDAINSYLDGDRYVINSVFVRKGST